jgi:alpha-beta hydrolase superfamily lysophospholipase
MMKAEMEEAGMPRFYIEETLATQQEQLAGCDAWRDPMTEPTPATFGDYSTLVLAGQFDTATPPEWSEYAASILPNAQLVHIPNAAHSILGNNGPCPTDIASQFLDAPGQPVDASCTDAMAISSKSSSRLRLRAFGRWFRKASLCIKSNDVLK